MTSETEEGAARVDSQESVEEVSAPSSSAPVSEAHAERIALLFAQYHGKLVKSLAAQTRSWEEAREIASDAFAAMLAHERPGSVGFFGAYLYRTARNLATDHLRRRSMRQRKDPLVQYEAPHSSPSPEPVFVEDERRVILQRAIAGLSPRVRMALVLRIWDELPHEEIVARFAAKGVRLTERTVRRYLEQAFAHCRRELMAAERPRREDEA